MAREPKPVEVRIPDDTRPGPAWTRIGAVGLVGLLVGLAWPRLAGVRVGPRVPGASDEVSTEAPAAPVTALAEPEPTAAPVLAASKPVRKPSNKQVVVVGEGNIEHCHKGTKRVKPEHCGRVRLDGALAPKLQTLSTCPSAIGLAGQLEVRFDVDFKKNEIVVGAGKKSELPATTVQGIFTCLRDYVRDVQPDKLPHTFDRYRVGYVLDFYPPGTQPRTEGAEDEAEPDSNEPSGLATVTWDSAPVRDEPSTGKMVMRLVRGTRVKLLSRRNDWYHVKIRNQEGWIYRGAIGL